MIDAAAVKALRDETGAGMMDCKQALQAADGDHEVAKAALLARGFSRKAGLDGTEGLISVWSDPILGAGVVEINCTTDFAARTDDLEKICRIAVETAVAAKTCDVNELLAYRPTGSAHCFKDVLGFTSALLRESLSVARVAFMDVGEDPEVPCSIHTYVHGVGNIGVIVKVAGSSSEISDERYNFGRSLAMHIAAAAPAALHRLDLPAGQLGDLQAAHYTAAVEQGKPMHIADKIAVGKADKFCREVVLLEQKMVMYPDVTVKDAAKLVLANVVEFKRFQLGTK